MIDEKFKQETLADAGMADRLNAAFDATGVTFLNRAAALKEFKATGRDFTVDADGTLTTHFDGQAMKASDALLRFGYDRRDLVDGRTLPRLGAGVGRPGLQSKADFGNDTAAKVAFISTQGEDAWARLPLTSPDGGTGEIVTREQFDALPVSEKVRGTTPMSYVERSYHRHPSRTPSQGR